MLLSHERGAPPADYRVPVQCHVWQSFLYTQHFLLRIYITLGLGYFILGVYFLRTRG